MSAENELNADVSRLLLEWMTLDAVCESAKTLDGVPLTVTGVVKCKVYDNPAYLKLASEQFLGKSIEQIKNVLLQTLEGHLRAVIGTWSAATVNDDWEWFAAHVRGVFGPDIGHRWGFNCGEYTIKDINDKLKIIPTEVMSLNSVCENAETSDGVLLTVTGVMKCQVSKSSELACEQFLGKSFTHMENVLLQTLEKHIRANLGKQSVETVTEDLDLFAALVRELSAPDFARLGFEIDSYTIKDYANMKIIPLKVMTLNSVCESAKTSDGMPLTVTGVIKCQVSENKALLSIAREQFFGKSVTHMENVILQTLEKHVHASLGKQSVETINEDWGQFAALVQEFSEPDFARLGIEIDSYTITNIDDKMKIISLGVMTLNSVCESGKTLDGVPLTVTGVVKCKVSDNPDLQPLASEQFLGKSVTYMENVILQTLEKHIRAILGTQNLETINDDWELFATHVREVLDPDINHMGIEICSYTIEDIDDKRKIIPMEVMTLNSVCESAKTSDGVLLMVTGVIKCQVSEHKALLSFACDQFLGKPFTHMENVLLQTLEKHIHANLVKQSVEAINEDWDLFAALVQELSAPDFARLGIEIDTYTIKDIAIEDKIKIIPLEWMTLDAVCESTKTLDGVPLTVSGVVECKVMHRYLETASEQFLGKSIGHIENVILQTLEGHVRAMIGTQSAETINEDWELFAAYVRQVFSPDIGRSGIDCREYTIKDINDKIK